MNNVAEMVMDLMVKLSRLGSRALWSGDASSLERVRDVIDGELETEKVLEAGKEQARKLTQES